MRSPAQKPAYKDLKHTGQSPANALEAAYTPVSNRAGSRSLFHCFIKGFFNHLFF
ncbi:acetyltransferase [Lacticaseibacillus paracasei]|nr:acetyltransferase [Lacticaseibacillus paracasei]MBG1272746.1 acetyltransferase [Lacticaseibacillus paracasei subsp. paracasei]AYG23821.1 acetyltransferase [Lacticaseibacillus paracasei]OSP85976.1 acetyltransferase [Lacticaseibacillus paracasei]PCL24015.1 acetyltransferase [Lacticaseibacillus paracasei]